MPAPVPRAIQAIDARLITWMRLHGVRLLRYALGVVFVWFGALKLAGRSPVEDLVAATIYWVDPGLAVPVLGAWEVLVGVGLLVGRALRVVLGFLWLQMAGTFLVLVLRPGIAFQDGNPFLPTTEGEFVIKNLVLIAAGIAVGATVRRGRAPPGPGVIRPE